MHEIANSDRSFAARDDGSANALTRARTLISAASVQLGDAPQRPSMVSGGTAEVLGTLNELETALSGTDHSCPADTGRDARLLVADLRAAQVDVLAHQVAKQRLMLSQISHGLARLRAAETLDDLVASIPIETVALGYERAMFSWVDREYWVPCSMHTASGPAEAREILAAGAPPYAHTRDLLEVDVVRHRRPILVLDCATNPRMHPTITPVSQSRTYVAAPVIARKHVAGFVHLDRNLETGLNDEFDRDLLTVFCEGIGLVLDRLLSEASAVDSDLPVPVAEWYDSLTEREREVLAHMASGLTNAEIANRLYLSHETIRTHVKRVMGKLGTHTRAEAGAMYHRAGF